MSTFATLHLPSDPTVVAPDGADGRGEMWRKQGEHEETVALVPGLCHTIPLGTHFQSRACDTEAVAAIGVTMPTWPGAGEAVFVAGPWR